MIEKIVVQFSEILLGAAAIAGIAIIFAATIFDLRKIKQKKLLQTIVNSLDTSRQPSMTIVVFAFNNPPALINCLTTIAASRYVNHQVVVAYDASDTMTKKIISAYKRRNKNMPIALYPTKIPAQRMSILRLVHNKLRKNELLFTIDATDKLTPDLLQNAAARFVADEKLTALRLRPVNTIKRDISSLPYQFIRMSKNIFYKAIARHAVTEHQYHESGVVTRSSILSSRDLPDSPHATYDSALLFVSPLNPYHKQSVKPKVMTVLIIVTALVLASMISYFLYTTATLQSNILLTLSWLLVVLWLLVVIWSDEAISRTSKLELSLTVPFMYFVFYTFLIIYAYKSIAKSIGVILLVRLDLENLYDALQIELYSTRY